MDFICLDAETTDRGELLELSVYNIGGKEVYHQYFKPENARRWRTDIHHITPEMVRDKPFVRQCRRFIQQLVDEATHIIGFAVDNDIRILEHAGIERLDEKEVVEVRQWLWYCIGRHEGVDINGGPGLATCAEMLGVALGEDAHSASADTLATLQCFTTLAERYRRDYCNGDAAMTIEQIIEHFNDSYAVAREQILRERAHGTLYIVETVRGHRIVKHAGKPDERVVASVTVADRFKAEVDFRRMFAKRRSKLAMMCYDLRPSDIEAFERYSNEFELEESEFSKRLLSRSDRSPGFFNI